MIVERKKVEKLEEELKRVSVNEQDLEKRLLETESVSTELVVKHGELQKAQRTIQMLEEATKVLKANLATKVEEGIANEEMIKKGIALVEDLENKLEAQDDVVSQLEEAQLVHAKELEAARAKLTEELRSGEIQAKELEASRSSMLEEQQQVAIKLDEVTKQLGKAEVEKEETEKLIRAMAEKVHEKECLESSLKQVEGRLADVEYELGEVEKQRDLVSEQCTNLEQQLEEAKQQRLEDVNLQSQRLHQLEQKHTAATQMEEKVKELEEKLLNSSKAMEELHKAKSIMEELEKEVRDLKFEVEETEKQRDAVDAACDKLEEEKKEIMEKMVEQSKWEQEKKVLMEKLLEQKHYSDKMYELNLRLQGGQELSLGVVEDKAVLVKQLEEVKANRREVLDKLEKVKEELGRKNIAYASLKVDVEKGELEYKKKCEVLQSDLDYEKAVVTRLTQDARRLQVKSK